MEKSDQPSGGVGKTPQPLSEPDHRELRQLLDDYLRMYATRDDTLTGRFSENFSGFTGGGDFLVKDTAEWVAITRLDFSQVKEPLRLELKDVRIQSLTDTVAVATSFFTIHLPIKEHILSRETARLVLVFHRESEGWKIAHSSISIPYQGVRAGEVYPLQDLQERNRFLEEQVVERTAQLSQANDRLHRTNGELAVEIGNHERTERQLQETLASRTRELREATAAALRAGAEEEDRIGQELHDTLCPELIGVARQAETLTTTPVPPGELENQLLDLAVKAGNASRLARNLSHRLARPDLVHADFSELLEALANNLEKSLELNCDLTLDDAFPALGAEQSGHLIRIIREAVANAARHGRARHVWIDCVRQGRSAMVSISNNGDPLPPPDRLKVGLGTRQMRMRADLLEGALVMRNGLTGGAVVELTFPVPADEAAGSTGT